MLKGGGKKVFAYFTGSGRPVEVEEGGKISVTRGHFIVICNIEQLTIIYFDFLCNILNVKCF